MLKKRCIKLHLSPSLFHVITEACHWLAGMTLWFILAVALLLLRLRLAPVSGNLVHNWKIPQCQLNRVPTGHIFRHSQERRYPDSDRGEAPNSRSYISHNASRRNISRENLISAICEQTTRFILSNCVQCIRQSPVPCSIHRHHLYCSWRPGFKPLTMSSSQKKAETSELSILVSTLILS